MQHFDAYKHIRPCPGYRVGGDTALIQKFEDGVFLAIVDVLGHGLQAHDIARNIEGFLLTHARANVVGLMNDLHAHILGSRGAWPAYAISSPQPDWCITPGSAIPCFAGLERIPGICHRGMAL